MALPGKNSAAALGAPYSNGKPVEDPTTDVDAAFLNEVFADSAAMTHTVTRAIVKFVGATYSGSGTDHPAVASHDAVWGSGSGVTPTIDHAATGAYVINWPTAITDELGVVHTIAIRYPLAPVVIGADGLRAKVTAFTANTITIATTSAGAASDLNGTTIIVSTI